MASRQGQRQVAAALKLVAGRNKPGGQQAKKPPQKAANGAAGKKRKAGVLKDKGAQQYNYDDGHGDGFEVEGEDDIHEVDPNVVNGRLPVPVERPKMQSRYPPEAAGQGTDDEEEDEKDALEDPRGQGSTRGSTGTGLQSGQSHVSRGVEDGEGFGEEEDPNPPRSGSHRTSELAKCLFVSCIV